ncbi:MAG: DegT/DnrJ/EryC1/StrS family aminotransferase, partial [Candidatus Daviesbacteria bacterium]|nr:DegT/DnrJ/EryC1/StrS family aminotransferase [Candidatus Daviesbacteria bacterium]
MTQFNKQLNPNFIPIAEPTLGKEEEELVLDALRSGWISSTGKYIQTFEEEFAKFCDVKYAVAVSNGTTALHLAIKSLDIGPGDEVIIPSLTFVATANAVSYAGAKPILIDVDLETWNIDPHQITSKINERTKAIIPVHLYGHPANMGLIKQIAKKNNLYIIEDAAEAHGAMYKKKMVGSIGTLGCFSFYGNKVITTGEGGMITTNNYLLSQKIRILRDHGASRTRKYYHPQIGYNYRMTNLQAAIGVAQLRKIQKILKRRHEIGILYQKLLSPLIPMITLQPKAQWAKNIFWMNSILINKNSSKNRDYLIKKLRENNIDSRPFFYPVHLLPMYRITEKLPITELLSKQGISLPSSANLSDETV